MLEQLNKTLESVRELTHENPSVKRNYKAAEQAIVDAIICLDRAGAIVVALEEQAQSFKNTQKND